MGIIDSIKAKADELDKTYNPLRQAGDAMVVGDEIQKEPLPSGQAAADAASKEAINAGEAARQEAIKRGKGDE